VTFGSGGLCLRYEDDRCNGTGETTQYICECFDPVCVYTRQPGRFLVAPDGIYIVPETSEPQQIYADREYHQKYQNRHGNPNTTTKPQPGVIEPVKPLAKQNIMDLLRLPASGQDLGTPSITPTSTVSSSAAGIATAAP
jgi:hypothetical protein